MKAKKGLLAIAMSVVLVFCSFPLSVFAQTDTTNLETSNTYLDMVSTEEAELISALMGWDVSEITYTNVLRNFDDQYQYALVDYVTSYAIYDRESQEVAEFSTEANSYYHSFWYPFFYLPEFAPVKYVAWTHYGFIDIPTNENVDYLFENF